MRDYDLPEVENWLDTFQNFERSLNPKMIKLEMMKSLVEYFGHPEKACPCFHVAGSKGKGTIVMSVASLLTKAGKKVGVFMSPHVLHFTERVRSGEGAFEPEIYAKAFEELKTGIDDLTMKGDMKKDQLTWFELVTVFSMLVFREAKVDYAVYEVGMGGRLDATNVISPVAIGMGLIELEHTKILGDTIEKIASEKAGIFKKNVPIFSVPQLCEARSVFAKKVREMEAEISYVEDKKLSYLEQDEEVARMMVRETVPEIDVDALELDVELSGRYEKITEGVDVPYVLMDGAHTEMSIKVVLERMKKDSVSGVLLFAIAKDKNVEKIAKEIVQAKLFSKIFLTKPGSVKQADLPRAEKALEDAGAEFEMDEDYERLIARAFEYAKEKREPLIVLGSFYLVGEVKKFLGDF